MAGTGASAETLEMCPIYLLAIASGDNVSGIDPYLDSLADGKRRTNTYVKQHSVANLEQFKFQRCMLYHGSAFIQWATVQAKFGVPTRRIKVSAHLE